jgi:CheY-like chemotaxis protein
VAHDFNNLLTVVTSYSGMLLAELPAGDPARGDVEEISRAADRAAALTRQLLAFSRQQVLEPRVLDLNAVVRDLEKMLGRVLREDVRLETALAPRLGRVYADPGQLEQVIVNLAVNARDAMPDGGALTIETADVELDEDYARLHPEVTPGPYVMLAVSDTGLGMDAATQARVFEPFFTTKAVGQGTGLGLSTVYGILKQSGGHVAVYSEPGLGTTFKVYLPRVSASSAARPRRDSRPTLHRGSGTILLVEDEAPVRAAARRILERAGYTVLEAASGPEALRLCAEHSQGGAQVDLLLTDMVMPDMSGCELAARLRERHAAVAAVFMSGYTEDTVLRQGIVEAGAVFIQKPFTPQALTQKVAEVLGRGALGGAA